MKKTAVLIKTSPGRPSLVWSLASVKECLEEVPYRVYIADEKPLDSWKVDLYQGLEDRGHFIHVADCPEGVGLARNHLLRHLENEDQVLRLDDDFELGGEFKLAALESVLWSDKKIGFCADGERQIGDGKGVRSGFLRPYGGELLVDTNKQVITKQFHPVFKRWKECDGFRYRLADFTRNLLLIKREVAVNVGWSERLRFQGEHVEFMLSVRDKGFLGAYTRDSVHLHRDDLAVYRKSLPHSSIDADEDLVKKELLSRWGCVRTRAKYGVSWYALEGIRRLIAASV